MTPDSEQEHETTSPDEAALDGQVRAFLENRSLIQAHIGALVRDATMADDVFQEVWLRFEKVTRRGEVVANVSAWCRAAARLVALEMWRGKRREQPMADPELAELVDRAYEEQDGREDFWHRHVKELSRCIGELPAHSRQLVSQRYYDGEPIAKIAESGRRSVGSVKTALCRVRLVLADCVRRKLNQKESYST